MCCKAEEGFGLRDLTAEALERFRQLENTVLVYGNHDRHVINIYESGEWTNVADGKYKWVHYNCERLSEKRDRLDETASGKRHILRQMAGNMESRINTTIATGRSRAAMPLISIGMPAMEQSVTESDG